MPPINRSVPKTMQRPPNTSLAIVIPTHNRPELILETLASVGRQTCPPSEVIVVDDGSRPPMDAARIASQLGAVKLVTVSHAVAQGGWSAKNDGAFAASTELVTFLDDDDLIEPEFVERVQEAFAAHPELDVLFVNLDVFGTHSADFRDRQLRSMAALLRGTSWRQSAHDVKIFEKGLFEHLVLSVPMAFQRPVARRQVFVGSDGFRPYRTWWEGEWAIRMAASKRIGLLDLPLHSMRVSGQGNFTLTDTKRSELEIEIEIKERLRKEFAHSSLGGHTAWAASNAHLDYAYFLFSNGVSIGAALRSWFKGMVYRPRLWALRLLGGGLWRALLCRLRREHR